MNSKIMKLPKVLQICHSGMTLKNFVRPLIDILLQEGWDVESTAARDEFTQWMVQQGYKVRIVPFVRTLNPIPNFLTFLHYCKIIKEGNYDCIHTHTTVPGILGRLAGRILKVKFIISTQDGFFFRETMPYWLRILLLKAELLSLKQANFVLCTGKEVYQLACRNGQTAKHQIIRLPGAEIEVSRFTFPQEEKELRRAKIRKELGIGVKDKLVITVARLVKEKGCYEFVSALYLLRKWDSKIKGIWVGDGSERGRIGTKLKELGLTDTVLFLGNRDDIADLLCAADVFTLPSWGEGQPVAPLEAMAVGLPVVLTNVRGCREEVKEGINGFLVPPRNPVALAKAIYKILSTPHLSEEMGKEGRKIAETYDIRFFLQPQIELYRMLYNSIISNQGERNGRDTN
jgi:glycosyltransferase involved in cell wall biosynthesis